MPPSTPTLTPVARPRASARLGQRELIADGINANLCQTGPDAYRLWGIRAPATAFNVADGAAGSVTAGTHLILITFAVTDAAGNTLRESAARLPATSHTAAGAKKLSFTNLPVSDDSQVNARNIYMTAAAGSAFYRVATVADNSTTTATVDLADTALGAIEYSNDNVILPAKPCVLAVNEHIVLGGDIPISTGTVAVTQASASAVFTDANLTRAVEGKYLSVAGSSTIYIITYFNESTQTATLSANYAGTTASAQPYRISHEASLLYLSGVLPANIEGYNPLTEGSTIGVGLGDGQAIRCLGIATPQSVSLEATNGTIVVCKDQSTYIVRGSPARYDVQPLVGAAGGVGPLAGCTIADGSFVWYAGPAGIYRYHPASGAGKLTPPDLDPWFADEINHDLDYRAHMAWLSTHNWLLLWVAPTDSTVTSKLILGDFSRVGHSDDLPVRWWECRLPATCSRIVHANDVPLLLIGTPHGAVWALELGISEAADDLRLRQHAITATGSDYLDVAALDLPSGENLSGVPVRIITGPAASQSRYILSASGNRLTLDDRADYGGPFSPAPAAGDQLIIGAIDSSWATPQLTLAAPAVLKRWHQSVWDFQAAAAPLRVDHAGDLTGTLRPLSRHWVPAHLTARSIVPTGFRSQRAQLTLSAHDAPWTLRALTIQAAGAGELRP